MWRQFLSELRKDWVALVSGGASVILVAAYAVFSESPPAWVFWPTAYLCLVYAGYRLWVNERLARTAAEEKLAAERAQNPDEAVIRAQIATLTRAELLVLKQLATFGELTETQVTGFCRNSGIDIVTPDMLSDQGVRFITRDIARSAWSVVPLMRDAARKVMANVSP